MYTLTINSKKGPLNVSWSDIESLAYFAGTQAGYYLQDNKDHLALHNTYFNKWNQMFWSQREDLGIFDIPDGAKIVDIGSGVAVVDLLLYSYVPKSTFYLVDYDSWTITQDNSPPFVSFSDSYPSYNSWSPVIDAIKTSKFDANRFHILNTSDKFPDDVDVITSYFSWCFHYPKSTYWDRVMNSLKIGGKLIIDVRPLHGNDVIGEISEELKCTPIKFKFPKLPSYSDTYPNVDPDVTGYRCIWTRN
jgi:hypothetical protein